MASFNPECPMEHNIKVQDPDLSHIPSHHYKASLYQPSDDSYLFMEALEQDLNTLRYLLPQQPTILEMGCGTGILSAYLSRLLTQATPLVLAKEDGGDNTVGTTNHDKDNNNPPTSFTPTVIGLDINPLAVEMTNQTYHHNNIDNAHAIQSDLLTNLPTHLQHNVNVLLFNPPYVPTYDHEVHNTEEDRMIMNAYAGGAKGRDVLDLLLPHIHTLYDNNPFVFYCVFLWPHNDITELNQLLNDYAKNANQQQSSQEQSNNDDNNNNNHNNNTPTPYVAHIIHARQCGLEALAILRFTPRYVFNTLPTAFTTQYPVADDDNLTHTFKPRFTDKPIALQATTTSVINTTNTPIMNGSGDGDDSDEDDEVFRF